MLERDKNVCGLGFWQKLSCFRLTGPLCEKRPIMSGGLSLPRQDMES